MQVQLISTNKLKNNYLLDDNLDDAYIIPQIIKCQDFIIEPLLGEVKYNEIILQVSGNTVSAQNDILISEYIQPIIAYYVMSEVIYVTAYKFKNKGIETGDGYKYDELVKLSNKYRADSDAYQIRLKDYVCDEGISIIPEKETKNIPIFFPKKRSSYFDLNYLNNLPDRK